MKASVIINQKIRTRLSDAQHKTLVTDIVEEPLTPLINGEILVEMLFVPIHGSFWLASHPYALHPRIQEFLVDGGFVFGNGGVGRVVAAAGSHSDIQPGDYVSIMGHLPCQRRECHACGVLHRYTECDFGEGRILGHGNHAPDGTFARFCALPRVACEVCFKAGDLPSEQDLLPYMLAFLLADVRNAMTRHPETLSKRRMLLIGAGYAGHLAAWLLLQSSPDARILVADTAPDRLSSIRQMSPNAIETLTLTTKRAEELAAYRDVSDGGPEPRESIKDIQCGMRRVFSDKGCDLVFDGSSGNTLSLWLNSEVLRPGVHCIPFGFGSRPVMLDSDLIQLSGLTILMSRGVGNLENRRTALQLMRMGASEIILRYLVAGARRLEGIKQAIAFIREQHDPPRSFQEIARAYIVPSSL